MNEVTENTVTILVLLRAAKLPVTANEIAEFANSPFEVVLGILLEEQENGFVEKQPHRKCQVSERSRPTWRITPIGEASLQAYLDSVNV